MKNMKNLIIIVCAVLLMVGCKTGKLKTTDDLIAAYNGESTASAKYAAFADKAKAEGYDTIAVMFMATSNAEAVHARNHLSVLVTIGAMPAEPEIGKFEVKSTLENLADALEGETYEVETMYPAFIADAEKENKTEALDSFTWAYNTERKHMEFYRFAINSLNAGSEKTISDKWYVCPVCGNTYNDKVAMECEFCLTEKERFDVFSVE